MKSALLTSFLLIAFSMNAQQSNLQSAISNSKGGDLRKAKAAIDQTCLHPTTKDTSITWYYAAAIYAQIGMQSNIDNSQYKNLDSDWLNKAYNAAIRCSELDKKKEYKQSLEEIYIIIGLGYYKESNIQFNQGQYRQALSLADRAVTAFHQSRKIKELHESYYLAGLCCYEIADFDGVKKYYEPLVKVKTSDAFESQKNQVYLILYKTYRELNEKSNALRMAKRYAAASPENVSAQIQLASAYVFSGDTNKAVEVLKKNQNEFKNNDNYPLLLCAIGYVYEEMGDLTSAKAKYNESLKLKPRQFEAYFAMANLFYKQAADNSQAAMEAIDRMDYEVAEKMIEKEKDYFSQAIPYLKNVINYIDALPASEKKENQKHLYNALIMLKRCYESLDKSDDAKAVNARITKIEQSVK